MHTLLEYLESHPTGRYSRTDPEFNEPLILLYRFIHSAVKAQCDTLSITPAKIVWKRQKRVDGHFPLHNPDVESVVRETLKIIVAGDPIIQTYLHCVRDTPDELCYRVEPDRVSGKSGERGRWRKAR